jgi:hypothetical protein
MGRINLQSENTTLRLSIERKARAHSLAQSLNLSLAQFIEMLIDRAELPGQEEERIRCIVREEISRNTPELQTRDKYPAAKRRKQGVRYGENSQPD